MKRRIIQFGDQLKELFVFTPFEEEDDWSDSVEPSLLSLQFADGSFRMGGFDQSRKASKTVTKRFVLNDSKAREYFRIHNEVEANAYLKDLIDYLYATLRGGVKKLYAVMEDGSIRYAYAEAISIPYTRGFSGPKNWVAFSVDFVIHEPYWYEVNDGATFFLSGIPLSNVASACSGLTDLKTIEDYRYVEKIDRNFKLFNDCEYKGIIVNGVELLNYTFNSCILEDGCREDECFFYNLGTPYNANGLTEIEFCIDGSAGASFPKIGFLSSYTNPKVENLKNGDTLEYLGNISASERLVMDLSSSFTGEPQDFIIDTNIAGFDVNDIVLANGLFRLERGVNILQVTGGSASSSVFTFRYENKNHN